MTVELFMVSLKLRVNAVVLTRTEIKRIPSSRMKVEVNHRSFVPGTDSSHDFLLPSCLRGKVVCDLLLLFPRNAIECSRAGVAVSSRHTPAPHRLQHGITVPTITPPLLSLLPLANSDSCHNYVELHN